MNQDKQNQQGRQQNRQGLVAKDTDGDGRTVQPGRQPGEIDGDKQNQKR